MMSAVEFDPREQGEVTDFEITNVSEERRTPLDFKALLAARQKADRRRGRVPQAQASSIRTRTGRRSRRS